MSKPGQPSNAPFTLYHLQPKQAGQTLASALKQMLPEASWGKAQHWIVSRHVQINGNLCCDPARRMAGTDVIKLWREPLPRPVTADQLRLPYLDEHLLVVEKSAGITSVWHRQERDMSARRKQLQPTLEELLPAAIDKAIGPPRIARSRGGGPKSKSATGRWPIFPVHRLDRDTSGLMIFARTRLAEQKLIAMFRDHRVLRQYWAVVHGQLTGQTIRTMLVRDRGDGLRGSLPAGASAPEGQGSDDEETGQLAVTHVEHVEALNGYSIVRCRLETGRTHQIRIHLSELGHPLCGEKTYVRLPDGSPLTDHSMAPRQALHAERLSFTHPLTGEQLRFTMPLPSDLRHWLKKLRVATRQPGRQSLGEEAS